MVSPIIMSMQYSFEFSGEINKTDSIETGPEQVRKIFSEVYLDYKKISRKKITCTEFETVYFRSHTLNATLKVEEKRATLKLSARCLMQPETFHRALSHILWSRIFNCPCSEKHRNVWRYYESKNSAQNRLGISENKPGNFRKSEFHDLQEYSEKILKTYFPKLSKPVNVLWAKRAGRNRLGSYCVSGRKILINPVLDHPDVPGYVIESVIFHELLHHIIPPEQSHGRKIYHTRFFRRTERVFPGYAESERWLREAFPSFLKKCRRKK